MWVMWDLPRSHVEETSRKCIAINTSNGLINLQNNSLVMIVVVGHRSKPLHAARYMCVCGDPWGTAAKQRHMYRNGRYSIVRSYICWTSVRSTAFGLVPNTFDRSLNNSRTKRSNADQPTIWWICCGFTDLLKNSTHEALTYLLS